jgi:large subunit ribosomal protein L22
VAETVYKASHRRAPGSAKKMRLVINMIRGKKVPAARDILRYVPKQGSYFIDRVLQSAIANAESIGNVDVDELVVKSACVDEGPTRAGRWKYAAHGRVRPILKRSSHISIELAEVDDQAAESGNSSRKAKE